MPELKEVLAPEAEESEEEMLSNLTTISPDASKEDKEDAVLFPENHLITARLLDHTVDLRPLPISVCKKLSRKIAPVATTFEKVQREGGDAGDPELDITTIDTLLECVGILAAFYKFPSSLSKERLEDELSPEELIDFLQKQLILNRENNFLLFNLRGIIRAVDLVGQTTDSNSDKPPSTPPTVINGESDSESSLTPTPTDS